jgi:hypothetical protein
LKTRGQSIKRLDERTKSFVSNIKSKKKLKFVPSPKDHIFCTKYDQVSNSHEVVRGIIRRSISAKFTLIHKSLPSVAATLCPKRKIMKQIANYYHKM